LASEISVEEYGVRNSASTAVVIITVMIDNGISRNHRRPMRKRFSGLMDIGAGTGVARGYHRLL